MWIDSNLKTKESLILCLICNSYVIVVIVFSQKALQNYSQQLYSRNIADWKVQICCLIPKLIFPGEVDS